LIHAALAQRNNADQLSGPSRAAVSAALRDLRNPEVREKNVLRSVVTSSAIEEIRAPFERGAQAGASSRVRLKRKKS
jgi:hypothetical protein